MRQWRYQRGRDWPATLQPPAVTPPGSHCVGRKVTSRQPPGSRALEPGAAGGPGLLCLQETKPARGCWARPSAAWEPVAPGAGTPQTIRAASGKRAAHRRLGVGGSARPAWRIGTACTCACGDPAARLSGRACPGPSVVNIYPSPGYVQGLASPGSPADPAHLPPSPMAPGDRRSACSPRGPREWTPHSPAALGGPLTGSSHHQGAGPQEPLSQEEVPPGWCFPYSHLDPWPQRSRVWARAYGKPPWGLCDPSNPFPLPLSVPPLSLSLPSSLLSFLPSFLCPHRGGQPFPAWAPQPGWL